MKKSFFIFLLSLLGAVPVKAQEPVYINIDEKYGLPDNEIYSILEDESGYIWIAGNKGLFRYNGKEFEVFSHPKKRGRSFFNLRLDSKGRVWCNNIAGQFFYVENDKLKFFGDYQDLLRGNLSDFTFFNKKLIIKVNSKEDKKTSTYQIDLTSKNKTRTDINISGTAVGITINDEFYFINAKKQLASVNKNDTIVIKASLNKQYLSFTKFFKTPEGFFITCSDVNRINTELYFFNETALNKITLPSELLKIRIEHIHYSQNQLYVSTSNGTYIISHKANRITIKGHYLKTKFITKALKDSNQNLWLSSLANGIYVMPNETLKEISTKSLSTVFHKINATSVLIGLKNGQVFEYNTTTNHLKFITSIKGSKIRAINFNPVTNNVLVVSDAITIQYNLLSKQKKIIPFTAGVKSVSFIDKNKILISRSHGTVIVNNDLENEITNSRSYVSIYSKINNKIFISGVDGLKTFDVNGNFIKEIKHKGNAIYAFDVKESNDGKLWLATYDKGVLVLENDNIILELNSKNGLASNITNTLQTDANNVWIATEEGLQFYDTESKKISTVTKQNGIGSYTINELEVVDNTVLFSSNLGLFSFDKQKIFKSHQITNPYITHVSIEEKDVLVSSSYTLKQTESNIRFQFNTKGFQSSQFINYQYQLKGFSNDWINIEDGSDYIKFTSLPAGKFSFNLRAKNRFSVSFSNVVSVNLIIISPFYKTWWFWFLIFLAVLVIVISYFKTQTKQLKKRQNIELEKAQISKDLVFSQLENLRSQMNPHFIFNALNSIQDFIITNEKKLARQYLVRFSKLIRTYLKHSQKNEISLTEELKALNLYLQLEKDRFEGSFEFEISMDKTLETDAVFVPSLFIQPYIENALKHGLLHKKENKKLNISFSKSKGEKLMLCTISDNGIGREASKKINAKRNKNHTSFATSANQKRIQLLNTSVDRKFSVDIKDLYDKNNEAIGTKVLLSIPFLEKDTNQKNNKNEGNNYR